MGGAWGKHKPPPLDKTMQSPEIEIAGPRTSCVIQGVPNSNRLGSRSWHAPALRPSECTSGRSWQQGRDSAPPAAARTGGPGGMVRSRAEDRQPDFGLRNPKRGFRWPQGCVIQGVPNSNRLGLRSGSPLRGCVIQGILLFKDVQSKGGAFKCCWERSGGRAPT